MLGDGAAIALIERGGENRAADEIEILRGIDTVLADRRETSLPQVTITREFIRNSKRAIATLEIALRLAGGTASSIYLLYFLGVGGIVLQAFAK